MLLGGGGWGGCHGNRVWLLLYYDKNNSIWFISWLWYDIWDEEEKTRAYTFTESRDLYPPKPYWHGIRGTDLWSCCKLYTAGKSIAAQLNVMAMTGFTPLSWGSPTQCLNQMNYLPTSRVECYIVGCVGRVVAMTTERRLFEFFHDLVFVGV